MINIKLTLRNPLQARKHTAEAEQQGQEDCRRPGGPDQVGKAQGNSISRAPSTKDNKVNKLFIPKIFITYKKCGLKITCLHAVQKRPFIFITMAVFTHRAVAPLQGGPSGLELDFVHFDFRVPP